MTVKKKVCLISILLLSLLTVPILATQTDAQNIEYQGKLNTESLAPAIRGWGGSRIHESNTYKEAGFEDVLRTSPPSEVFNGEVASDLEMTVRFLLEKCYNGIRVIFDGPSGWSESTAGSHWQWNEPSFARSLAICKHYGIWIIPCYKGHGSDPYQHTGLWLSFWKELITKFGQQYDKVVWEPCNEPVMWYSDRTHELLGQAAVDKQAEIYQQWINMCRETGDKHWLVVSAVCYWNSLPEKKWWPTVNDPLNKTFLGRHHYFFFKYQEEWNVDAAIHYADHCFEIDNLTLQMYGKPFFTTEFGPTTGGEGAPDQVYVHGYTCFSNSSLAFVQRLMSKYESNNVSYVLFPCSDIYKPRLYGDMRIVEPLLTHLKGPS
jgi:hypothetical protein